MLNDFLITLFFAMLFVAMPLQIAYIVIKKIVNRGEMSND